MTLKAIVEIDNPFAAKSDKLEQVAKLPGLTRDAALDAERLKKGLPRDPGPKWQKNGPEFELLGRVGRQMVAIDMVERLGGFAYSRNRKPHQELAATWFKAHYEAKYGSGMSAIDLTQTPVQSGHRFDKAFAELKRLAKQQDIADAIEFLGKEAADLLIQHLIFCMSVRQIAEGSRARAQTGRKIFAALDRLAQKLGYAF